MKHSWPSCEKQAWPVWRRVNADMKVTLTNDGPVTIVIDTDEWKR